MLMPLEAPRPFLQLPPVSREVSVSKPSVRIAVVDGRQRSTARTQNPLQPSFLIFFFPVAFWESISWLFPVSVHDQESWEEGRAATFPD